MIAILECTCGVEPDEYFFEAMDDDKLTPCRNCGEILSTKKDRRWDLEGLQIQGDTVSGGVNYDYMDPTLGRVTSKQDRADKMRAKGLIEYSPNEAIQPHVDNLMYDVSNAAPHEVTEARKHGYGIIKEATKKDRKSRNAATFGKAWDKILTDD